MARSLGSALLSRGFGAVCPGLLGLPLRHAVAGLLIALGGLLLGLAGLAAPAVAEGTGGAGFFRCELMRVTAGMGGAASLAGDLALAGGVHGREAASGARFTVCHGRTLHSVDGYAPAGPAHGLLQALGLQPSCQRAEAPCGCRPIGPRAGAGRATLAIRT